MIELLDGINLEKYMGTWLEMARKPAFFKKPAKVLKQNMS